MLSINILAQFLQNRADLLSHLTQLKPNAVVVMDEMGLAVEIKTRLPQCIVVHRSHHPDDAEFHMKWTPTQFANVYLSAVPAGIVVQVLNEPFGYGNLPALAAWCATVMAIAAGRGIQVCVPNFGVGNPTETPGADLDGLWEAFRQFPQHYLGLHEYFQNEPADEPYRTGRFRNILRRFDQLRIPHPKIIISEAGHDIGGGPNDGWRAVFDEVSYAARLERQASIYKDTSVVAMCIFCAGRGGGGMWQSFDVETAGTVKQRMVDYNRNNPMSNSTPTPPLDYGTRQPAGTITLVNASVVNIRNLPTTQGSTVLGQFKGSEVVPFYDTPQNNWWQVEISGRMAYVSDTYINITAAPVDPHPPVFLPELEFDLNGQISKAELASWLRAVGDVIEFGVLENVA